MCQPIPGIYIKFLCMYKCTISFYYNFNNLKKKQLIKPIINFLGVAWGCRWSWDTVGVFKEICYCETNNCNGASSVKMSFASVAIVFVGFLLRKFL